MENAKSERQQNSDDCFLTPKKRDHALDLLKLTAMLMVVFSHCAANYVNNYSHSKIMNAIWLTQIPLFIIVSGILSPSSSKLRTFKSLLARIGKNALTLLVPCFSYMIINLAIGQFNRNIMTAFSEFYSNPETNLWFLWVLFLIEFVFEFGLYFASKTKNKKLGLVIPLLTSFIFFLPLLLLVYKGIIPSKTLGIKLFVYYIPYYCIGYLIKQVRKGKLLVTDRWKKLRYVLLLISCSVFLFEVFYFDSIENFPDSDWAFLLIRVAGSLSSCYCFGFLAYWLVRFKTFRFLSKAGMYSLECYYLHIFCFRFLKFGVANQVYLQWATAIGAWFLILAIVTGTLVVIYFVPFSHMILFGKPWSYLLKRKKRPLNKTL
jgi:surface polysaccharide O-acyltransferase-like enzyme